MSEETIYRLYVAHMHEPGRPLHATSRTFSGKTLAAAERKAHKFFRDGKFHHMGWALKLDYPATVNTGGKDL